MQHKFDYFTWMFAKLLTYGAAYLSVGIIMIRFRSIADWSMHEVFLLVSLSMLSYTLAAQFLMGLYSSVEEEVRSGSFDRSLLVPLNPLLYLVAKGFSPNYASQIALAVAMLVISTRHVDIPWTATNTLGLVGVIVGGTAIQGAVFLICSCTVFWTLRADGLVGLLFRFRSFVDYPLTIYPQALRWVLTFVVPYGFVNYYPSVYILGKAEPSHTFALYLSPIIGSLALAAAYFCWLFALKRYQGTGS